MELELLKIAEGMATRLRLWQRMRQQAEERGETSVELHPAELFENQDKEALQAWDKYLLERSGKQPLPFRVGAEHWRKSVRT